MKLDFEEDKPKKVFLGGTCNNSTWRNELIPFLNGDFFNPVVPDWTEEDYQRELRARKDCAVCLYVITPLMKGVYSIAELIDDSNKRPRKTVFFYLAHDQSVSFDEDQLKSLRAVGKMVEANGGTWCKTYNDLVNKLNETN